MIYNLNGFPLSHAYNKDGFEINTAYDKDSNIIYKKDGKDPYIEGRLLIFEDDFTSDSINTNNWLFVTGHTSGKAYQTKLSSNAYIENNCLVLREIKENYLNYTWTCGGLNSRGKKSFMYGRFEAKIRMPIAFDGAFWFTGNNFRVMYPNNDDTYDYFTQYIGSEGIYNWPECGEIDVAESWSYAQKNQPQCNLWSYDGTSLGHGTFPNSIDTVNHWHIYAMERTRDEIIMYIDDIEYHRWNLTQMTQSQIQAYIDKPISIILGIGIGAEADTNRVNEAKMYVDWVRVYAPIGVEEEILPETITIQSTMRLKKGFRSYLICDIQPISTTNRDLIWSSDNNNICSTDSGYIMGNGVGTTNIHATTVNGLVATCSVTVVEPEDF